MGGSRRGKKYKEELANCKAHEGRIPFDQPGSVVFKSVSLKLSNLFWLRITGAPLLLPALHSIYSTIASKSEMAEHEVEAGNSRELFKYCFVSKAVTVVIYEEQEIEMSAIFTNRSIRWERV